jgi:hypothetical protein
MSALIPVNYSDHIINFGACNPCTGKLLSWAVKYRNYWLHEYVMCAYSEEVTDIVEAALKHESKSVLADCNICGEAVPHTLADGCLMCAEHERGRG